MHILWFWWPHSGEPDFPLSETQPVTYPRETHGTAPGCPSSVLFCPSFCGLQRNVGTLLPLLTLLLERALQERAVDRVIHIFILESGAQHSLPLFLPLDYICSIKRVFKSHVRSCGLRTASVICRRAATWRHRNRQRPGPVRGGEGAAPRGHGVPPHPHYFHLASFSSGSPALRDSPQHKQN